MTALERLQSPEPLVSVELRPPRSDLSTPDTMDVWIDLYHAIQGLTRQDALVFLTDNAVGQSEEENLAHLVANLGKDVDRSHLIPFLTTKHSLEYCHLYARRAVSYGFDTVAVLGGDKTVGTPRVVPHAYQLRESIRTQLPDLHMGGWANPRLDPVQQVDYLLADDFSAEFVLTQIVSHHSIDGVERFLGEMERRNVTLPVVFGVFYYRSANPATLKRLGAFFPVPMEGVASDFAAGLSPLEVCLRTIRALRTIGIDKVYVSNLGVRTAAKTYRTITRALEEETPPIGT